MRKLGPFEVWEVGLGCMNLSHAYGDPVSAETGKAVLSRALDLGIDHFDSAALYGFGRNEELVGPFLKAHREKLVLVSKCGLRGIDGVRTIDARPAMLRKDVEASLRRLRTDVIDLYYLHRYDKVTPIEDSVGEMSRFVEEGKVRAIGLSEVAAGTIRKAHAVHPIAAVQSEYSLWSRNPEIAVLDTCNELGISFVAFSPLARGYLTDTDINPGDFTAKDVRRGMPRFNEPAFSQNQLLLPEFRQLATDAGVSSAQLALRWVLEQAPFMHVIPGTTSVQHLAEDLATIDCDVDQATLERVGELINQRTVSGPRYAARTQLEIDTEQFEHEHDNPA